MHQTVVDKKNKRPVKTTYALAYFSSQVNGEENKDLEIHSQLGEDDEQPILSCKTRNGVEWSGRRDVSLLRTTRLVLLCRSRRTGRITLVSPSVEAYRFVPLSSLATAPGSPTAKTKTPAAGGRGEKRSLPETHEEFYGTAKKRRIAEARRLNASVSAQELKAVVATASKRLERTTAAENGGGVGAAAANAASTNGPGASLLPPRDPRASHPSGVFNSDALCPPLLRAALLPEAERLAASGPGDWAAWRQDAAYPASVLQRLPHMPTEAVARVAYCLRLVMLACMRRFYSLNYKQVNKNGPLPGLPEAVAQHLLATFTVQVITNTGQHRALPATMKDKQLVHMIILCLQLDGYSTDMSSLMAEFRLTSVRLQKLLKVIGCDVVTEKAGGQQCKMAKLRAPAQGT